METPLSLATESFSYSWLSNSKPPLDGPPEPLRLSIYSSSQNFNFDVSNLQSPSVIAHADELFSDGLIRPVFIDDFKGESYNTPDSFKTTVSSSSFSSRTVGVNHGFLRKWRRSTRQSLRDLFQLLNRFCRNLGWLRRSTRVGDIDKAEWEASPEPIGAYSDHENSIYEAVLHCKKSIEE